MHTFWQKLKSHKFIRWFKLISESAAFALLLSIIFFAYEMIENMKESQAITDNLVKIEKSLSTRYLGVFPNYLPEINDLFRQTYKTASKDTIIIFEDVLYYGIISRPKEFIRYNERLLELADSGFHIIIAYYDFECKHDQLFRKMVQDERFPSFTNQMHLKRDSCIVNKSKELAIESEELPLSYLIEIDSILSETFFREEHKKAGKIYSKEVQKYLRTTACDLDSASRNSKTKRDIYKLCVKIDSIKVHYLNKDIDDICFEDFRLMYVDISKEIRKLYVRHNIQLIPLHEYMMMSCWLYGDEIIFAFPSRNNTEEIGFYSHDPAFAKYVKTMLKGVQEN